MRKIILIVIGFFSFGVGAAQQTSTDTVCVRLYFRRGYSTLDAAFRGNGQRLEAFVERVEGLREDSTQHLRRICIEAGASPEGGWRRTVRSASAPASPHVWRCARGFSRCGRAASTGRG